MFLNIKTFIKYEMLNLTGLVYSITDNLLIKYFQLTAKLVHV